MPLETLIRMGTEFVPSADEQLRIIFRTRVSHGGGGAETRIVGLRLYVDSRFPYALRRGIPQFAHLRGFAVRNATFVESMIREIDENGALGFLGQSIATRLGEALLTKCLREVLEAETNDPGVHRALSDPYISRVIGDMQRHPERDWSIELLARTAGLSRSAFLDRFDGVMGTTPAQFQAKLRMSRAVDLIESTGLPLSEIALKVGYSSEAAFNRAFHREMGATPGSLRKTAETSLRKTAETSLRRKAPPQTSRSLETK
jgi:AraC-like DNA-binding protein